MWSKPIQVENNHSKEKFYSFFIDTEGLGAYDEEINHDSKIFLVAVLISSLFILNSFGNIDENAINSLSFIINLSKAIKLNQSSSEANAEDLSAYFPSLLWLLRDFSLKLEDTQGNVITAKQYLENALQLQKGTSEAVEEKNKIRKLITSYFKERDCFSMVRPIENEKDLQNLQSLDNSFIRREFLEQAETLRHKVFKKVKPKVFNGKVLSGSMLIELLVSIIDSINKGAVPVIENSWKYMLHNESLKNLNCCLEKFKNALSAFKESNKENPNFFKDLKKFETETINELVQEFNANSISAEAPENGEFVSKMRQRIQQEFERFNDDNSRLFENRMNDALERHSKKIYEAFETDKYVKNYYIFFKDLENLKDITESAMPDFKNKKEAIFEKMLAIIKKFIETTFIKNKIAAENSIASLKQENQSLSNKLSLRGEEHEKLKAEAHTQLEKLNTAYSELKLKEKTFEEKFKQLLNEKKNAAQSAEEKINSLKTEMSAKLDKHKADLAKAEAELRNKDDHLKMIKFSEDKMNALNAQKLEYLERDLLSHKERLEAMKYDNAVLCATRDEQAAKIVIMQEENNKVKLLEMDNERLRKDYESLLAKKSAGGNLFAPKFNNNKNNFDALEDNYNINNNYASSSGVEVENDYETDFNQFGMVSGTAPEKKGNMSFGVRGLHPSSDAYVMLQLIKDVLSNQANQQSNNLVSLNEHIRNTLEKISKENEEYLIMNKVNFILFFVNFN